MAEYSVHVRDGLSLFDGEPSPPPPPGPEENFARLAEVYGRLCSLFSFPIGVLDA